MPAVAVGVLALESSFTGGPFTGCPWRGGARERTTRSRRRASSISSRRSKSSTCFGNASASGSTHRRITLPGSLRSARHSAQLAIIELMGELDHLQPERPGAHNLCGQENQWLGADRPAADAYTRPPQHPPSHLV